MKEKLEVGVKTGVGEVIEVARTMKGVDDDKRIEEEMEEVVVEVVGL